MAVSDFKTLWQLQKIDLELDEFQKNKIAYPQTIESLKQKIQDEKKNLDQKKQSLLELEKKKKSLELDLSEKEEKIKKSEERMMAVKSNEEYLAMKKEVEISKQENAVIEEHVLEVMLQIDEEKKRLKSIEQDSSGQSQNMNQEIKETEENLSKIDALLIEKQSSRDAIAKDLKVELLSWYTRIRKRLPLAVVESKEGRCMGCHISLPPQLYNLILKGEEAHSCPNCNRILIFHTLIQTP